MLFVGFFVGFFAFFGLFGMVGVPFFAVDPFVVGHPVELPAEGVENLFLEVAALDVFEAAEARDETFEVAFALSGKTVGGAIEVALTAPAGRDVGGEDLGTDEFETFVGGLEVGFVGMKGEAELAVEVLTDGFDVAN